MQRLNSNSQPEKINKQVEEDI